MNEPKTTYFTEVSNHNRFGLKGSNAATWLASNGLSIPTNPNSWLLVNGALVLRLGASEFVIEISEQNHSMSLFGQHSGYVSGLYQVPRYDACWLIQGSNSQDLFAELCLLNLEAETAENKVCMTQIAGINAIVLRFYIKDKLHYYLLCDRSYHHYMQETLTQIAQSLGDVVFNTEHIFNSFLTEHL